MSQGLFFSWIWSLAHCITQMRHRVPVQGVGSALLAVTAAVLLLTSKLQPKLLWPPLLVMKTHKMASFDRGLSAGTQLGSLCS